MRSFLGIFLVCVLMGCASAPSSKTVELPSAVTPQLASELAKIGPVVAPPPTEKLYAPLQAVSYTHLTLPTTSRV